MSDQDATTREIIDALRHGEKIYRGFKNGVAAAQTLARFEGISKELQKNIDNLTFSRDNLINEINKGREDLETARNEAKKIVSDAEERAAKARADAEEEIKIAHQKSQEELDDAAETLAAVREEVSACEVERDKIKADIAALKESKAKALALVQSSLGE